MTKFKKGLIPLIGLMGISTGLIASACSNDGSMKDKPKEKGLISSSEFGLDYHDPLQESQINAKKEEIEWEKNSILGSYDVKLITRFLQDNQLTPSKIRIHNAPKLSTERSRNTDLEDIRLDSFNNDEAKSLWGINLNQLTYDGLGSDIENYWKNKTNEDYKLRSEWRIKFTGLSVRVESFKNKEIINPKVEKDKDGKQTGPVYKYNYEGWYTALGFLIQNVKYPDITLARLYDSANRSNNNPFAPMSQQTKIGFYILKGDGHSGTAIPFGIGLGHYYKSNETTDQTINGKITEMSYDKYEAAEKAKKAQSEKTQPEVKKSEEESKQK
ncbi:hypothetical protein [Mycoplasma sp. E35C]|uniref:hypothetical protein n=1 Tax=Mycoplasma sp. E35C TaxID=2801918 RepID=UPI001CA39A5C|nr:hypothetical protein [Mycoplasma sp. E35C]QZX49425.1 hypothetical protein JJE79_01610 [Mycoplasma sp. E35C]